MVTTNGFIISKFNYGETSVICKIFTKDFGLISFIIKGVRKRRASTSPALLFSFSPVEIEFKIDRKKDLQQTKSLKSEYYVQNIQGEITKSTICMFLAELIQRITPQHEANKPLYDLISEFVCFLEEEEDHYSNSHLIFALQLLSISGFGINNNRSDSNLYFNIREGKFQSQYYRSEYILNRELSLLLSKLLEKDHGISIKKIQKHQLLEAILSYYNTHFISFGDIKTLPVLQAIFA
ncbi:MAG: DNA repair protein RecO [Hyphomicrobiales bacterium]